jgi:hypothetical protein
LKSIASLTSAPKTVYGSYTLERVEDDHLILVGRGNEPNRLGGVLEVRVRITHDWMTILPDTANPVGAYSEPRWARINRQHRERYIAEHARLEREMTIVANRLRQYYRRPESLGGGQGTFERLLEYHTQLSVLKEAEQDGGIVLRLIDVYREVVVFEGRFMEKAWGTQPMTMRMFVTAESDSLFYDSVFPCY